MTITIEKKINETIEVKPGCYKGQYGFYFMIDHAGNVIRFCDNLIVVYREGESAHSSNCVEAMDGEKISEAEFMKKYKEVLSVFTVITQQ